MRVASTDGHLVANVSSAVELPPLDVKDTGGTAEGAAAAAHAAMLHCGARGYLKSHRAQRRLREAYFVAIVTPATKQLRKMLADA